MRFKRGSEPESGGRGAGVLPQGVLLEPHGNQSDTLETPQSGPRPPPHTHTRTLRHDSQTTEAESRAQLREHHAPPKAWERRQDPRPPGRSAHFPRRQLLCAHSLHPQTHRHTRREKSRQAGGPRQPTTCAHTLPRHQKHRQPSEGATCLRLPPRAHTITILRPADRRSPARRRCPSQGPRLRRRGHFPLVWAPGQG